MVKNGVCWWAESHATPLTTKNNAHHSLQVTELRQEVINDSVVILHIFTFPFSFS